MLSPHARGLSAAIGVGRRSKRNCRLAPLLAPVLLAGCVSYQPAPLDTSEILHALDEVTWSAEVEGPGSGNTPRQLAALAVTHHPSLEALRAELGVARARLVEAGLLPDPQIGWGAMDLVASEISNGTSGSEVLISGLSLMFPLLRPGERDARVGSAEWQRNETLQRILTAEWELTQDVYLACEELVSSERLLAQMTELTGLARSTAEYFQRARGAGAATAIQANLAEGQLHAIRLDVVGAEARLQRARQGLNALLGLPPAFELHVAIDEDPSASVELQRTQADLTSHAVENRPDLAEVLARYEVAEQEVRLAVAQQYPLVAIGTGISVTPGFFSQFGRPAIQTAIARRERLHRKVTALVHQVRQEIASALTRWEIAQLELELIEAHLLPNAEVTLELSRVSFKAGEMTLLESLALQRSLVEARTRHTEARGELSKSAWSLLSASGLLLTPDSPTPDAREEVSQ